MSQLVKAKHSWSTGILFLFIAALFTGLPSLHAQGYGKIVGTVTDSSGAVVPSVTVIATATHTGVTTKSITNSTGYFVFPAVLPADYSVRVTATGFKAYSQTGIVLQASQSVTLNIHLQIGSISETVNVTSAPPQVDTTSGTLSQVIDRRNILDLPLNGRNAATLTTLVAGVVTAPDLGTVETPTKTFPGAIAITSNGTLAGETDYLLDGGNNIDEATNTNAPFPFPDALQEFSVQTSNYSAQYGQNAGAVVNIVTKSGTDAFHGDAFFFLRNGAFDARNYFASTVDNLHRNQYGGTIGGPVIIPKVSKGKSTQFFFGYQRTTDHQNSNASSATVPTLAEEGQEPGEPYADFGSLCSAGFGTSGYCSNSSQQIWNPFTETEYQYNRIPASDMDPASMSFEKHIPVYSGTPAPGTVGGVVHYYIPTIQTFNEYVARVDHSFGDADHLFAHYYLNDFVQAGNYDPTNLLTYASFSNLRYQNALISETHIFSPHILNDLVVNYQRIISLRGGPPGSPNITAFGVQGVWQPSDSNLIYNVTTSGYFGVQGLGLANLGRNNYTFNDDLHWTKGSHAMSFGGHFELSKYDLSNIGGLNGTFSFSAVSLSSSNPALNYVNALANYQMGYMSGFSQGSALFLSDRNHFPGIYAVDSWKATRRLTLNYGVRWEPFSPWTNLLNQIDVFNPDDYISGKGSQVITTLPAGMLLSGDPGVARQGVYSKYNQFMPRVGFAYDLSGDGKTVVRGGLGIFYQDMIPGFFNQSQGTEVPFTITLSAPDLGGINPGGPFSNPYCTGCTPGVKTAGPITNPFPYSLPFPSNYVFPRPITIYEFDPSGNYKVPVTYAFNLTFEHQLFRDTSMRIAYVGSQSRHQLVELELNPAVNNGTTLNADQRRSYNTPPFVGPCVVATGCQANFSSMVEASMTGSSNYNSLQASLEKRLSHGLSLNINYTWSKALDDMPLASKSNTVDFNAGQSYVYPLYPAGASAWNPTNIKALDYGPSDFNHKGVLSASYLYFLPRLHGADFPVRMLVNGWELSGIVQHYSGDPLTVIAGKDISLTGLGQDRGERIGNVEIYSSRNGQGTCGTTTGPCVNYLASGAFQLPVNTGPNSGTGFGNVMKGSIVGPAYTDWDAAVIRSFPIYRESSLEFRAEYFDVLNHTILADPSVTLTSTRFGQITSENGAGPRIGQFSLKVVF